MARRQHVTLLAVLVVAVFLTFAYLISSSSTGPSDPTDRVIGGGLLRGNNDGNPSPGSDIPPDVLNGGTIAPKLENATAKAELGHAAWKVLHTTMARFPEKPTSDESLALNSYIHLFARLYPCGDCAQHFQKILAKYPPQTSGRTAAAGWACFVHNEVNKRLEKPEFDCSKIGDFYDCGCGEDESEQGKGAQKEKGGSIDEQKGQEDLKGKER